MSTLMVYFFNYTSSPPKRFVFTTICQFAAHASLQREFNICFFNVLYSSPDAGARILSSRHFSRTYSVTAYKTEDIFYTSMSEVALRIVESEYSHQRFAGIRRIHRKSLQHCKRIHTFYALKQVAYNGLKECTECPFNTAKKFTPCTL